MFSFDKEYVFSVSNIFEKMILNNIWKLKYEKLQQSNVLK